jgi:hypothetical protein
MTMSDRHRIPPDTITVNGHSMTVGLTMHQETDLRVKPVSFYDPPEAFELKQYLPGLTTKTIDVFIKTPEGVETGALRASVHDYILARYKAICISDAHIYGETYQAFWMLQP